MDYCLSHNNTSLIWCLLYVRHSSKCFTNIKILTQQPTIMSILQMKNWGHFKDSKTETQMREVRHKLKWS